VGQLSLEPEVYARNRDEELRREAVGCDFPRICCSPPDPLVVHIPMAETVMAVLVGERKPLSHHGLT